MILQPLLKPQFTTNTTAAIAQTFDVVLVGDDPMGLPLNPQPAIGFTAEDAVLKLAMMLKALKLTPDDLFKQLEGHKFQMLLVMVADIDGKKYDHFHRIHAPYTHEVITSKLREFFPQAEAQGPVTREEVRGEISEESPRMESMHNTGSTSSPSTRKGEPKERKLTTVYQGGGDSSEKMAEVLKQLTPENMPKGGVVITMGKNGPRILKTASARTDEEDAEDLMGENEANPIAQSRSEHREIDTSAHSQAAATVSIHRDPNTLPPGVLDHRAPVAKTASKGPALRTVSGDQMERMAMVGDLKKTPQVSVFDASGAVQMEMGSDEAAALIDREMGTTSTATPNIEIGSDIAIGKNDPLSLNSVETRAGHRVKTQSTVVKKDRGNSPRPASTRV